MGKKWKPLFSTQKYWEVDCKRKNESFNPERRLFSTWSSLYSKPNYHPRSKVECRLIVFLKTAVETNGANGDVFQKSRPKIQWRQIVTQKRTEREWRKQSPGIRWVRNPPVTWPLCTGMSSRGPDGRTWRWRARSSQGSLLLAML